MMKAISVIIPIYNLQHILSQTLDSVLKNAFKDYELILVNDGSTDNSLDICKMYKEKDSRIVIIDKENGGLSSARNAGLDVAKGKYICFVDGDDLISNDYFEKLFNYIDSNNLDWVECARYVVDENGNKTIQHLFNENVIYKDQQIDKYVLNHSFYNNAQDIHLHSTSAWGSIYLKERIGDLRFREDITYGEDTLFNYEFVQKINSYGYLDEPLYYYMTGNSVITKKYRQNFIEEIFVLIDNIEKLRVKYNHDVSDEEMVHTLKSILSLFVWHTFKKEKEERFKDYELIKNRVKECEVLKHLKPGIVNYIPFKPVIILFNKGYYELLYRLWRIKGLING